MLLLAERIDAAVAFAAGFLTALVEPEAVATRAAEILDRLVANAPLTIAATRALLRVTDEPDDDIVGRIYASADFHEGVEAFLAKRPPIWRGK
jgi:enoyl-CoA hydratase/carnithine racemase